jgi:hypothetical protein
MAMLRAEAGLVKKRFMKTNKSYTCGNGESMVLFNLVAAK